MASRVLPIGIKKGTAPGLELARECDAGLRVPPVVNSLLTTACTDHHAWDAFVTEYTPLLLHVVKSVPGTRDDRMDTYARILEALRAEDYRRLRTYAATPHSKFTTWLVVVAKRICIDYNRALFGRGQADPAGRSSVRDMRRRIHDLIGSADNPDELSISDERGADTALRDRELSNAVTGALRALDPDDRLLLALRFRDGLSTPQIARVLKGRSALSVYRRLSRILDQLRNALITRGIDGPIP